jgi:hypothetical protein
VERYPLPDRFQTDKIIFDFPRPPFVKFLSALSHNLRTETGQTGFLPLIFPTEPPN